LSRDDYLRGRLDREIIGKELRPSYRIFRSCHEATPLGTAPVVSRLRPSGAAYRVAYFSPDYPTAFPETIVRDPDPRGSSREITASKLLEHSWVPINSEPGDRLNWVRLHDIACIRLGFPTDAIRAGNHAAGRAPGQATYTRREGRRSVGPLVVRGRPSQRLL